MPFFCAANNLRPQVCHAQQLLFFCRFDFDSDHAIRQDCLDTRSWRLRCTVREALQLDICCVLLASCLYLRETVVQKSELTKLRPRVGKTDC